jgi:hypothetical protein
MEDLEKTRFRLRYWCLNRAETRQQQKQDAVAGKKKLPFWGLQTKF